MQTGTYLFKIHKKITNKKLQIQRVDKSLWMSPSPAGDDWSAVWPVELSPTNQSSNLPPCFRPSAFWINTLTVWSPFFSPFIVYSGFRWFPRPSLWTYVCICVLMVLCLCVCVWARLSTCVKLTVCDSWWPQTEHQWRGVIRYFLCVFITHSPMEIKSNEQICVSPLLNTCIWSFILVLFHYVYMNYCVQLHCRKTQPDDNCRRWAKSSLKSKF